MHSETDYEPVNMGNPNEFTIKELAELVIEKVNPKLNIIYKDLPQDDPLQRKPDISRAEKMFNWTPNIQLNEGLDKTISHFDKVLKAR